MRILFMGTPAFAVSSFEALCHHHQVIAAYSQPPKPAGRGHAVQMSPVHQAALHRGVPVFTPSSLKSPEIQAELAHLHPDVIVVAAYGLLLPKAVLDIPRYGCWNVHASLLPRWRGAAPIQHAIWAGDTETGITIMQMEVGLDTGPMLLTQAVPITESTTTPLLHDQLARIGADLIVKAVELLPTQPQPTPQPNEGITYATKLTKAEGRIDWRQPASQIHRQIRALNPWPGTWLSHAGEILRVLEARVVSHNHKAPSGTVVDDHGTIACGTDALQPLVLQRPGGKRLSIEEFLRGYPIPKGTVFSYAEDK